MTRRPAPAVTLRRAAIADIDDVLRILRAIWVDSYDELTGRCLPAHRLEELLVGDRFKFISDIDRMMVACRDHRVVGWMWREQAFIDDLWVEPPEQGRGIGKLLLDDALARIKADGYRLASLDCIAANSRARRFYEREGWRPVRYYERNLWQQATIGFMLYEHDL